jgi:hypothetical protein
MCMKLDANLTSNLRCFGKSTPMTLPIFTLCLGNSCLSIVDAPEHSIFGRFSDHLMTIF